ncbi:hypothetical protein [Blattabacterium cuenoti]|uniref:hypothetical protein n=1 Tax=Blattabacterium cuenoti TaxID=1653831 RepID=UPI00163CDD19
MKKSVHRNKIRRLIKSSFLNKKSILEQYIHRNVILYIIFDYKSSKFHVSYIDIVSSINKIFIDIIKNINLLN